MTTDEIKEAVNKIISGLDKRNFNEEAINWGDLHVCSVDTINEEIRVTIEEADPTSQGLCAMIEMIFFDRFDFPIEVVSEW